jgi:hypothetical protein
VRNPESRQPEYPARPQQTDVSLRVSVTVEAEHKGTDGFDGDTVRTISENAKTLRFRGFGWEKE